MFELFVAVLRAASAARDVLVAYWPGHATTLSPVMNKLREGMVPVVLLVVGFSSGIQASGSALPEPTVAIAAARDGISLDEAVSRAERQYRARVVRTDVQDEDGRKVYVLKLLSEDGRVFTVRIDAATGRMR